ncbi:hypothetical protein Agub_g8951 [Astrephomene gubernaculifera]|uniref:CUE domain-containing protein n=1 Tax=Astrephomene gubernaculifera TaxID=47775 RepID=A0AAD3DSG7_9CHLO|nr:hypothetical protein Agub_g8951 [Astrephomene gubernaculifera]
MSQCQSVTLPALQEMFPEMSDDILLAVLDAHNNDVETSIAALLEMSGDGPGDVTAAAAACHVANLAASTHLVDASGSSGPFANNAKHNTQPHYKNRTVAQRNPSASTAAATATAMPRGETSSATSAPGTLPLSPSQHLQRGRSASATANSDNQGSSSRHNNPNGSAGASTKRKTWGQLRAEQQQQQQQATAHLLPPSEPRRQHHQQQQQQQLGQQHGQRLVSTSEPGAAGAPRTHAALSSPAPQQHHQPRYTPPGGSSKSFSAAIKLTTALRHGGEDEDFPALPPPGVAAAAVAAASPVLAEAAVEVPAAAKSGKNSVRQQHIRQIRQQEAQEPQQQRSRQRQQAASWRRSPSATEADLNGNRRQPQPLLQPLSYGYADAARIGAGTCGVGFVEDGVARAVATANEHNGWQAAAVDELCRTHGWAGRDLIEAVCTALQFDLCEVVSALDELCAAASCQEGQEGGGGCRGGSSSSSFSSSHASLPSSSSDDDDDDDSHDDDNGGIDDSFPQSSLPFPGAVDDDNGGDVARDDGDVARDDGDVARDDDDDFAVQSGGPHRQHHRAEKHHHRRRTKGEGGAKVRPREGALEYGEGDGQGEGEHAEDAYYRHRREANKLTHAWRKKMNRASAAFAAGDRPAGRQLVAEAQEIRRRAAAAHLEAAGRIEAEMNAGRQLSEWQLDLHGLHADEALQALARRISALELGSAASSTAATARASAGGVGGNAAAGSSMAGTSSNITNSNSDRSSSSRALASRRVLQVIVGRGLHSSGGEASLPRVVQAYLLQQGYKFTAARAGLVEVQLRQQYAVTAAAAGVVAGGRSKSAATTAAMMMAPPGGYRNGGGSGSNTGSSRGTKPPLARC